MSDLEWWYVYSFVAVLAWMGGMLAIPRIDYLLNRFLSGTAVRRNVVSVLPASATRAEPSPSRSQSDKKASQRRVRYARHKGHMTTSAAATSGKTACTELNGDTWEIYQTPSGWRWRRVASSGRIASSQAFVHREECIADALDSGMICIPG